MLRSFCFNRYALRSGSPPDQSKHLSHVHAYRTLHMRSRLSNTAPEGIRRSTYGTLISSAHFTCAADRRTPLTMQVRTINRERRYMSLSEHQAEKHRPTMHALAVRGRLGLPPSLYRPAAPRTYATCNLRQMSKHLTLVPCTHSSYCDLTC